MVRTRIQPNSSRNARKLSEFNGEPCLEPAFAKDSNRKLEQPIIHRYKEIEEFPQALNNSQMWNWSTRLFITEAKQNLTEEEAGSTEVVSRVTREEVTELETKLKEHESWLNVGVETQKSRKYNEDPAIETAEMRRRAEELARHLQRLVKRKVPIRSKKKASSATESAGASKTQEGKPESSSKHDEL
jgi:hypoxia up-regulated 1